MKHMESWEGGTSDSSQSAAEKIAEKRDTVQGEMATLICELNKAVIATVQGEYTEMAQMGHTSEDRLHRLFDRRDAMSRELSEFVRGLVSRHSAP